MIEVEKKKLVHACTFVLEQQGEYYPALTWQSLLILPQPAQSAGETKGRPQAP